jgi:endonuclease/exonuclease/phosphatase family metal-dependent hydrolase
MHNSLIKTVSWAGCIGLSCMSLCCREKTREPTHTSEIHQQEEASFKLSVMSLNVRYESPDDQGGRSWSMRIPRIVRLVRREKVAVFGIQEALHGQAADLWASLSDYEFYGLGRDDGKSAGETSGIFYQRSLFQHAPEDCGTFWLSDTPEKPGSRHWGNEFPRTVAWMRLVDRETGRGFYVFNTHWDHRNQASRERSALLLARQIDAREHPTEPVILLGDFNAIESNPGLLYLTGKKTRLAGVNAIWKNSLVDAYQACHPAEKNRRTLHFWTDSRAGELKVDHILVSYGVRIEGAEILSQDKPMVSDHFPVTARLVFPAEN